VQIQEYSEEYKEQILNLILNIQNNEFNIEISANQQPDLSNIKTYYQSGLGNFWVALHNHNVVGTISILDISNAQAALRKMFVQKEYRGPKFKTASNLLAKAMEWSASKNIKEIFLGTTPKFIAAHRFYEKNDFVEIGKESLPTKFPLMKVDTKFYKYTII
jgi:N-acetylglutamate synthase-like GNAT family acetyltransferase